MRFLRTVAELVNLGGLGECLSIKGSRIQLKSPPIIRWVESMSGIRLETEGKNLGRRNLEHINSQMWHASLE